MHLPADCVMDADGEQHVASLRASKSSKVDAEWICMQCCPCHEHDKPDW